MLKKKKLSKCIDKIFVFRTQVCIKKEKRKENNSEFLPNEELPNFNCYEDDGSKKENVESTITCENVSYREDLSHGNFDNQTEECAQDILFCDVLEKTIYC